MYQDKNTKKFVREIAEVVEFYVDENNDAICNTIYKKNMEGKTIRRNPSKYLIDYLEGQGVVLPKDMIRVDLNESTNVDQSSDIRMANTSIQSHVQQQVPTQQTPQPGFQATATQNFQDILNQPVHLSNDTSNSGVESLF